MASSTSLSAYAYDAPFLNYATKVSFQSAERITGILRGLLRVDSVLDVGCALGTWLQVWQRAGIEDFVGLDGNYIFRDQLQIPEGHFIAQDVAAPFDLQRRFDLVECLEVAEHIPSNSAPILVENLVRHGSCILFSAAPPGQGGEYHVNEQPYEYWRQLFRCHRFVVLDAIRSQIRGDSRVAIWYRHNIFLYVHESIAPLLSKPLQESVVPDGTSLVDVSPFHYRLRKTIIRCLPFTVRQILAKIVARTRR